MKVVLLCVDKTKKYWLIEGEKEYVTKLKKHSISVEFHCIEPVKNKTKDVSIQLETEKIIQAISHYPSSVVIILSPTAKELTSEEFSKKIIEESLNTIGNIVFVIGGSDGLDYELLSKYRTISFSQLTFLHEMIRVILLEQVFRALEISKCTPYHK